MRIVTYVRSPRGARAGFLREGRVVDAWDALERDPHAGPGVRDLLPHLRELDHGQWAIPYDETRPLDEVLLETPVPDSEKIICIGLNYRSHAEEAGIEPPSVPTFFAKFRNALVPSGAIVTLPKGSAKVDYEAEVAFVVGRHCSNVSVDEALDHVAGYMLFNDLSARDLQFATPQWMPGKVFDGSAPCGPALVTPDEAGPHDQIEFELTLNGDVMQSASTADLIFSVPQLVAHLSTLMTLKPGDIVSTGTPSGVGSTRQPRVWLRAGDEIAISSQTLGRLETTIR